MQPAPTRLLIVDDDFAMRSSISEIARMWGFNVRSAEDGFSALAAIRQETPDILLSDLNMPGMSGFELLSVVRRRFPEIKVIAMSGAFPQDGSPLGVAADAFYSKGSSLNLLSAAVAAVQQGDPQPSRRSLSSLAPIWILRNGHDPAGDPYVVISCPECLRTFPQRLDRQGDPIHETRGVSCDNPIHYAILEPTDPVPPQRSPRSSRQTGPHLL